MHSSYRCYVAVAAAAAGVQLFTVSVPAEMEAEARGLVTDMAAGARLTYSVGGTLKYELPADQVGTTGLIQLPATCHCMSTHFVVSRAQEAQQALQARKRCRRVEANLRGDHSRSCLESVKRM